MSNASPGGQIETSILFPKAPGYLATKVWLPTSIALEASESIRTFPNPSLSELRSGVEVMSAKDASCDSKSVRFLITTS